MKKILITSYNLDFGGIEKALLSLLSYIDYKKYEVTLILEKKEGIFLDRIPKEVHVKEYKISNIKISIIRKIINRIKLIFTIIFNYHKYDFSCSYAPYCIPGSILTRYLSKNNCIWIHSDYYYLYDKDPNKIKHFFNNREIEKFKHIIFVANEAREHFIELYPELKDKTVVCNNLINYQEILSSSKESIIEKKPDKELFINVSRHEEKSKRLTRLIEASKKLINENYDFEVWMIGNGEDTDKYRDAIKENGLEDHIRLLGPKVNPYPYYAVADAFILTSEYEGFPVVYLESLLFNLPIITTIDVSSDYLKIKDCYGIILEKSVDGVYNGMKLFLDNGYTITKKFNAEEYNNQIIEKLDNMFNDRW